MPTLRNTASGGLQVVTDDQARYLEDTYPGVWEPVAEAAGSTLAYGEWKVSELRGEVARRDLTEVVSPTGANGQVVKSDLVDVLEADDEVPAEGAYVGLTDEEEVPDDG
jgi:hypothetical protein